jgi:hypothetical protein
MVLSKESKIGLTFGQIISLAFMFGGMITAYVNLNIKITSIEGRISANEVRTEQLEKGRIQNAENIETIRTENRYDHQLIMEKLDDVIKIYK